MRRPPLLLLLRSTCHLQEMPGEEEDSEDQEGGHQEDVDPGGTRGDPVVADPSEAEHLQ